MQLNLNYIENSVGCKCQKEHLSDIKSLIIGNGAIKNLPEELKKLNNKKVFLLADINTYPLAGEKIVKLLSESGFSYSEYIFNEKHLEPDEKSVGSAFMHYDTSCDVIVALGSGVINDIGKILSNIANVPYIIIATAPSMDGYASASSSMVLDGVKVTLLTKCADVIIGDTDILKNAPLNMLKAGLGDMLAKYISICEWRIGNLITGEYYCETIADLVRKALAKCVSNSEALLIRDDAAVEAVFEGLVISGIAMAYAGVSRPASGVEHYFSHLWDMRGLEFKMPVDLHGIQCAAGTFIALKLYEKIKQITPDKEKALKYVKEFNFDLWADELRVFLGSGAEAIIALEAKEQKYDAQKHVKRLNLIIDNWDKIVKIINDEIPDINVLTKLYNTIGLPKAPDEMGISSELLPMTFKASKDIRDKYVLSRLAWDLGIIDEII